MLQVTSAVEQEKYINETISVVNRTASTDLPSDENVENAVTIPSPVLKSSEWEEILKFYSQKMQAGPYCT